MSEYQYHEWQAVDRVLTPAEQAAVAGLSSHIDVSPPSGSPRDHRQPEPAAGPACPGHRSCVSSPSIQNLCHKNSLSIPILSAAPSGTSSPGSKKI